jgi:NADP-dependent 3-hydroxy acid dehydrogenase YdfG
VSGPAAGGAAGLRAIVTGAGSGIGAAIAHDLARDGARLILTGRRREALEAVAAGVASGSEAVVVPGDVRDYAHLEVLVRSAVERFGGLDVLVANAAITDFGPIAEADPARWQAVIETNVLGVLYGVRAALPVMLEQGSGHVVIVASVSGRVTYVGEPAYLSSKHAIVAFADALRMEVAEEGIRVSVIEPGVVETPLIHVHEAASEILPGITPLSPDDIARAVRYVLEQPPSVNVFEVVLRPTRQVL